MPPVGGKSKSKARDVRSRHTTPISTASTDLVPSSNGGLSSMSYEELMDRYGGVNSPPSSNTLKTILDSLKACSEAAKARSEIHDKGMRELARRMKELRERDRERDLAAEREAEEERKEKTKKARMKKEREDEHRPLAVGAHALARQDGGDNDAAGNEADEIIGQKSHDERSQHSRTSASPVSSVDSHQPRPAPAVPQPFTFGSDPSTFDDPTIYHIRDIEPYATDQEKQEILGVTMFPHSDLREYTVGPLPDRDLVNAKPANQVTAHQFQTYLEPFVRPFCEEDVAFLKERGDRVTPFLIPRRGVRSYKEAWAEDDQSLFGDSIQPTTEGTSSNEPAGSIEQMTDELAETSEISTGPLLARLLSALRPERRGAGGEATMNGDSSMAPNGDIDMRQDTNDDQGRSLPSAAYLPEAVQFGPKASGPKLDYREMDERLKQELRYIGFLSDEAEPDFDGHNDDEVAARLRYLQEELQRVGIRNGARKARVLELVEEAVAKQEWSTIAEDLDGQLNQAYLKRHRNTGKAKSKLKRPGGPGGGSHPVPGGQGLSKPSLGESIRALMQRRTDWSDIVGPVVDHGNTTIPMDTIFDDENMKRLMARESELWSEAQDQA